MIRYFDDGDRVGFEADSVKDIQKISERKEVLDPLIDAIKKINQERNKDASEHVKTILSETINNTVAVSNNQLVAVKKEVKKTKTATNVVLGVSIATLLIVGGDKGYELYKKFIKPKKSAVDKKPAVKK